MIFTTNDKGKIFILAVLVVIFITFIFWQWLNFLPIQKINREDSQDTTWQNLGQDTAVVVSSIKDSLERGEIRLGILEDEFKRQAQQDAVIDAFKDRLQNATTTEHVCNQESDCGDGRSCVVELTDDEIRMLEDGEKFTHFDKPTFCETYDDLLGCFFYAAVGGEIIQICAD